MGASFCRDMMVLSGFIRFKSCMNGVIKKRDDAPSTLHSAVV